MRIGTIATIIAVLGIAPWVSAQQFGSTMHDIFGKQFHDYQWLEYPLDNFGVATAYRDTRAEADPKHFLCATFTCLNIEPVPSSNSTEGINKQWLLVAPSSQDDKGYADYGCGGPLDAAISKHSKLAINAFLPKILSLLAISGNLQTSKGTTVNLTLASVCSRLLTGRIQGFIQDLQKDDYGIKDAARAEELVLIKGDVVVNHFEIKIQAYQDLKVTLEAKLAGAAAKKFGDDSKLGVELSRDQNGSYHLKTTSPLIVGVLAVRQPRSLGIGPKMLKINLNEWKKTTVPFPNDSGS